MTHFEFYNLVFDNIYIYLISFLLCALCFWDMGNKYTVTWFDPLRVTLFTNVFTVSVIVFLYFTNSITFDVFLYYLLSTTLFWFAFMFFANRKPKRSNIVLVNEKRIAALIFIIYYLLFIVVTVTTYAVFGIPLFAESNQDTYVGSGLGVLGRVMPFLSLYCMMYLFYMWENRTYYSGIFIILAIVYILITGILSGSRSSFIQFIFAFWGYHYFYKRNTDSLTRYYAFIVLFIVVSIFSFSIKDNFNVSGGILAFTHRAIASGDNYFMALPNDILSNIEIGTWYKHLFYSLLGPLRIISAESIPPPVGYQLAWLVNPSLYGLSVGPLSSPPLLGFLYFKWGGVIFCFIIGLLLSFAMFRIPYMFPKGIISSTISLYIYTSMTSFIGDVPLGMGYLFNLILNITLTGILCVIVSLLVKPFCRGV